MSDKQETRKPRSRGSSTETGYRVEARDSSFLLPVILRNQGHEHVITKEWAELPLWLVPDIQGVGIKCKTYDHGCTMLSYEAAMAFAYKCASELGIGHSMIEFRLVQYKLEKTHAFWREGPVVMEPIKETWGRDINIEQEELPHE